MAEWRVPLAHLELTDQDIEAATAVLRSGWLTQGPRTAEFEAAFAGYLGAGEAVAVSNGTAALHLAYLVAGVRPGDDVVLPSLTFVATANAVLQCGARPVFADIRATGEPWMDAESAAMVLTPRTRAIVAMHYGGHPGDVAGLAELAADRGLTLIEDAAHAVGGASGARRLGTFGAAAAFSMYANKNLAVGEGGVVVTADTAWATRLRRLRSHGGATAGWQRSRRGGEQDEPGSSELGFNYRFDEARAAMAHSRLGRLDDDNAARAAIASRYRRELAGVEGLELLAEVPDGDRGAHHLFVVLAADERAREGLCARLANAGIQTSLHYRPLHSHSEHLATGVELPLTSDFARRAVSLPIFPTMTSGQHDFVLSHLLARR